MSWGSASRGVLCTLVVTCATFAVTPLLQTGMQKERHVYYLHQNWQFRKVGERDWHPAVVPGCVHTDLMASGLIDDPFYRDNELKVQWVGESDWEYRCIFSADSSVLQCDCCDLVFDGLDTYATVFLNDVQVLEADNMFRQWRVPCKELLQEGANTLLVRFRSPIQKVLPMMRAASFKLPAANDPVGTSPYTRKAPYHYGWDWGPRLVTSGIWRPVYLEAWSGARIAGLQVIPSRVASQEAVLALCVEVQATTAAELTLAVQSREKAFAPLRKRVALVPGENLLTADVIIPRPRLWWPNGLGDQPLYTIEAELRNGERVVASRACTSGLRSLELRQVPDQWGRSFTFVINGVPVFAKGGNWIPADNFLNRVSEDRYRQLLTSCRDAEMNMVRVWGGGVYEDETFYRLCDELGLMVWQDFMFSCSQYPGDAAFLENVRQEAVYQVKRLRHHPCLVLWCGNNEMEWGWHSWGWRNNLPRSAWKDYEAIFHDLLPQVCQQHDPTRPYWPSSPSSNRQAEPNSPAFGDMHYWGVWHAAAPFEEYEKQFPRFMSEYGFQSFPELKTVEAYTAPSDHDIESPVMMVHQKHPRGNQLIREYMLREYPPPKDFASFLYLSQVLQGEGIKRGAEHLRRIKPRCMGSLYWQINDCWPVASWSSIDYFGRWKALHHYARRFYADLLVSPNEEDGKLRVYVVSDRLRRTQGRLTVQLMDFAGQVLRTASAKVVVQPQTSQLAWEMPVQELLNGRDAKGVFVHCALAERGTPVGRNLYFFAPPKELSLPRPHLVVNCDKAEEGFVIAVSSDVLALHVYLRTEKVEGFFSDNYFDLLPGQTAEVIFSPREKVGLVDLRRQLRVISLVDAFAEK